MQHEFNSRPPMQVIDPAMIARQPTMSKALALCQTMSGLCDQQFTGDGGIVKDTAQWSRIMGAGQHHFPHDKFNQFMDKAGNEAPLLWLLHSRGYDITCLHKLETETERELRIAKEALAREREKNRVLVEALHGRVSA
jgi:hypothetical protein